MNDFLEIFYFDKVIAKRFNQWIIQNLIKKLIGSDVILQSDEQNH